MSEKPIPFANTHTFYAHFGWFYATWTAMELDVDLAIGKILKITPEQTHALVAGLQFGPKAALLRSLLPSSDYKNVEQLKGFLTRVTKESLRNVFTHSFIVSDAEGVAFVHRKNQTVYSAEAFKFKSEDFCKHVKAFVQLAADFEAALGFAEGNETGDFAAMAIPAKSA
jgi:hypothetical protein